jgi:dTDP-3-amino-3,6-dideoxy-alpha-D-glucopyranose N,N-dimethyltransferase/dTDP-3-amino-3,4,6-trideoxy-alpha-D-glucopyranose N,N-dimethyltransferase
VTAALGPGDRYDRIYAYKDRGGEAARLRAVLAAAGIEDGARVIEAACGTGANLVHLRRYYAVEGFDLAEGMLAVARRKLPDVALWQDDMADFAVEAPADALVCLFGSVGYLGPDRLVAALGCFARAVRLDGVVVVEAFLQPDQALPGRPSVQEWDGSGADPPEAVRLVRAVVPRVDGRWMLLDFHWLIARAGGVEHLVDQHALWMATREELIGACAAAGLEATWLDPGPLTGRPLILARRR